MNTRTKKKHDGPSRDGVRAGAGSRRSLQGKPSKAGQVLFPNTRRRILALFFLNPDTRYYLREASRLVGGTPSSVQRELRALTGAGILESELIGIQKFFRANRNHPIFSELQSMVVKTFGLVDVLKQALQPLATRIVASFVFGSIASGEESAKSDIDVCVIGTVGLKELSATLESCEQSLRRPVNSTLFSTQEFRRRLKEGDHFARSLRDSEKLFVVGSLDDFARLGQE